MSPATSRRTFVRRCRLPVCADEAYRWHARAGALERLGPLRLRWVAEHFGAVPGREFRDRQVEGLFASWEHVHRFVPDGGDAAAAGP
jgi:uncharacterized protein